MDAQVAVALVTGIFGLLGAVVTPFITQVIIPKIRKRGQQPVSGNQPKKPSSVFFSAGIGGVVGVILGYFLISPLFASPCPPFTPTKVNITSPVSGSSVARLVTVQGTACHVPSDRKLWLLVVPEGATGYFPQPGPVDISADGNWSAAAYMGLDNPVDAGRGFVLIAALADSQGNSGILPYFAQSGPEFKGLEPLPQGVQMMTQVKVIRK